MSRLGVGLAIPPDARFLALMDDVIRHGGVDYIEIAPETTWAGPGHRSPFGHALLRLHAETGLPTVAHSVGFSPGSRQAAHHDRWLARIQVDHAALSFQWWTEHLGVTMLDGEVTEIPLPVPMDAESAQILDESLAAMRQVVPVVGLESTAQMFFLGDPMAEPGFLSAVLQKADGWLVLDLHNVYTMALNFGFSAEDYLAGIDLERVIEVHLSGGSESEPGWLPSGRILRLDSHDGPVPSAVWALAQAVVPRCPHLRGVTLERMTGTVGPDEARALGASLERIRGLL